jgi:hypothetical protein
MRKLLLIAALLTALVAPSAAQAYSFKASLKTEGPHPRGGHYWKIHVKIRSFGGKKLHGTACYNFLVSGLGKVASQCPTPNNPGKVSHTPYRFYGDFTDRLFWPKRATGHRITLQVVVSVKGRGTARMNYTVRVVR